MTVIAAHFAGRPPAMPPPVLIFEDSASQAALARLTQAAPSDVTVLLTGETGVGKEQAARRLHGLSRRADRPFVAVNCGAIPENLIEAELFGHERGAFTGAATARQGWFEAADGGTLFLDEVGELPPAMQVKLLRVLQEKEVTPVGSRNPRAIDLRLVAATNADLESAIAAGRFREDLYYRLNVVAVRLPPLRERSGDILPLARRFLATYGERFGKPGLALGDDALTALLRHPWPGNIRELENVIQRGVVAATGPVLRADDLMLSPRPAPPPLAGLPPAMAESDAMTTAVLKLLESNGGGVFDRVVDAAIRTAFDFCHGNQVQTAAALGISRNVLRGHLARLGYIQGRK